MAYLGENVFSSIEVKVSGLSVGLKADIQQHKRMTEKEKMDCLKVATIES